MLELLPFLLVASLAAAPANWVDHQNPKGFALKHPGGWVVETPEKDMVVVHDPTGGIQAVALGIMTRTDITPKAWLEQLPARFQKVRLEPIEQRRPNQASVRMQYTGRWGDGRAAVLCFLNRGAGMMFAIAAPVFRYDEFAGDLVQILQSFTVTQAPGAGSQQQQKQSAPTPLTGIEWTRWQDPTENAFSLEIPRGWRPEGGIVRRNAADVHGWIRVTSPEGIAIFSGDRDMTSFVVPTQTLAMSGFREGSRYSPGYGTQMIVSRYQPGGAFAEQYARRVGSGAIDIKDRRSREDLAAQANRIYAQAGGGVAQINTTFGDVSFATRTGQAGYVLAGTQLTQMAGTGMWTVDTLVGFLSPPARAQTAGAVMGHMLTTFQVNPRWFQGQQQAIAQTSRIVSETGNYVAKIQSDTYWSRQASQDRSSQNFSDYMRGVQVVVDPNTGQKYEAVAGHNYYYLPPGSTTTIATDVQAPPNIDLTELQPARR